MSLGMTGIGYESEMERSKAGAAISILAISHQFSVVGNQVLGYRY